MKIGFDARPLVQEKTVGVGIYILILIDYLIRKGVKCFLFYDAVPQFKLKTVLPGKSVDKQIKSIIIPVPKEKTAKDKFFWEQILLPETIRKEKIDLYHATQNLGIPAMIDMPSVLTLHDIIPFLFPDTKISFEDKLYYKTSSKISFGKADKIIAISNSTKKDFLKYFKIGHKKMKDCLGKYSLSETIKVIYSSIDREIIEKKYPIEGVEKCLAKYNLENKNYILYLGGITSRKNIEGLLRAYKKIKEQDGRMKATRHRFRNEDGTGYSGGDGIKKLAIMGNFREKSSIYLKFKKIIDDLKLKTEVVFTGYIPFSEKYKIISGATIVVYPSLYEGFGMPVLEAMSSKVPVITSNRSAIPEIADRAAILVNPYNISEISQAFIKILKDGIFAEKLINKGLRQVEKFSSERMGEETLKVYKSLLR